MTQDRLQQAPSPPPALIQVDDESPSSRTGFIDNENPGHGEAFFAGELSPIANKTEKERERFSWLITGPWKNVPARILLLMIGLLWPYGAISFNHLVKSTDNTLLPVDGAPSALASDLFAKYYPIDWNDPMNPDIFILLESSGQSLIDETSPAFDAARTFALGLSDYLSNYCWASRHGETDCLSQTWLRVESYYSFKNEKLNWLANSLASPNGMLSIVHLRYIIPANSTISKLQRMDEIVRALKAYGNTHMSREFDVRMTGIPFLEVEQTQSTQRDLRGLGMLALPLALLLSSMVLQKAQMFAVWMVSLVTMISSMSAWSIIMRYVAGFTSIAQSTLLIMMSLIIVFGFHFTVYFLSSYLENYEDKSMAINRMLRQGGPVVLLTGMALMLTLFGLSSSSFPILNGFGLGSAIAIGCALFVNLIFVPALLLTRVGDSIIKIDDNVDSRQNDKRISFWHVLCKHLLQPWKAIFLLFFICQLLIPFARQATRLRSSFHSDLTSPSNSPSLDEFHYLAETVGTGSLFPYRISFDGQYANVRMDSVEGFDIMHRVMDEMLAIDENYDGNESTHIETAADEVHELTFHLMDSLGLSIRVKEELKNATKNMLCSDNLEDATAPAAMFAGISVLKNNRIPYSVYHGAKACSEFKPHCPAELLHMLHEIGEQELSSDSSAAYLSATLSVNPFSDKGIAWLNSARETVERLEHANALNGVKVHIEGIAGIAYDANNFVHAVFPGVIGITMIILFLCMGIFFKSIVPPLCSFVSISFTVVCSFGLLVLVYQDGALDWTGIRALSPTGDEVCGLVPIMAFYVMVGLAFCQDVLLMNQIFEYRQAGYDQDASIIAGLHATGGALTALWMIVALEFGFLTAGSSPFLFQWSFSVATAALLHTSVIRPILLPILIGLSGRWFWWPHGSKEGKVVVAMSAPKSHPQATIINLLASPSANRVVTGKYSSTTVGRSPLPASLFGDV